MVVEHEDCLSRPTYKTTTHTSRGSLGSLDAIGRSHQASNWPRPYAESTPAPGPQWLIVQREGEMDMGLLACLAPIYIIFMIGWFLTLKSHIGGCSASDAAWVLRSALALGAGIIALLYVIYRLIAG